MRSEPNYPNYDGELAERFAGWIADYFQVPQSEALSRIQEELQEPGRLVASAWQRANPQTPAEVTRFYQETDAYVYDLAVDHCHVRRQPVSQAIVRRIEQRGPAQQVLLYGDGIGSDSIALARRGHRVMYFDLPGVTSAFARYRFKLEGLDKAVRVIERTADLPDQEMDAVVCVEVLEHVPDPPGVMRQLYRSLKSGGIALITESFECVGEEYPSHLPQNFRYAGRTHKLMEQLGFANTYYNRDPLNRPMEFTKTPPGVAGKVKQFEGKLRRALDTRWRRLTHDPVSPTD